MTLGQTSKPKSVLDRAKEIALKYVDLPYAAARNKVREETPCAKTTAHKAVKYAESMKGKAPDLPQEPKVTVIDEAKKEPAFLGEPAQPAAAPTGETLEGLEEIPQPALVQKVLAEGELTPEDLQSLFEAANDAIGTISEKRRPSDKSAKILGKLWYKPFNAWWTSISEKNPLLVVAVLVTVMVYAPSLIGVVIDWRNSRQKTIQKPLPQPQPDKK